MFKSLAGMDPIREENLHYLATRIIHCTAFVIFVLVFILVQLFPHIEDNSTVSGTDAVGIFILYLVSVIFWGTGIIVPKVHIWRTELIPALRIFSKHGFQVTMFSLPVVIGLLIMRNGTSFVVVLPAILISVTALIITFPTRTRWKKWTGYTSLLD